MPGVDPVMITAFGYCLFVINGLQQPPGLFVVDQSCIIRGSTIRRQGMPFDFVVVFFVVVFGVVDRHAGNSTVVLDAIISFEKV